MTCGESPMYDEMPLESRDRVMHVQLDTDGATLMGVAAHHRMTGGNTCINVDVKTVDEAERIFAALAEGGQVQMPSRKRSGPTAGAH